MVIAANVGAGGTGGGGGAKGGAGAKAVGGPPSLGGPFGRANMARGMALRQGKRGATSTATQAGSEPSMTAARRPTSRLTSK